jgi:Tol biopolymer transport system component
MNLPNPRLIASLEGRYRIDRELGQGGMATVYLAQDVRHDRMVALKVLRPELAAVIGAERFLAEIKTTAGLQHPHILPLHDSGEADGTVFYVMPYVEGESLRDRLNHEKQLPVEDAIRIAREIASALDYAHRHGIVHRDIKPENILLHDGQALVADFGISLAVSRSDSGKRMTETGMSLGTPSYMAPEQAMGEREITQKADIYALGCVLYEMLTGEPPFTGTTAQAIVARMVTENPRGITMQRHTVPAHIEAAVLMALEKLPADRFASAGEFAAALDNPAFTRRGAGESEQAVAGRTGGWKSRLAIPLGVVAVAALAAFGWMVMRPEPPRPVSRYALSFAESQAPRPDRAFAVSPDGSHLAYVGPGDGSATLLWLKARDREQAVPLAGTANVQSFTFSPDGQWIAFVSGTNQLRKLPIIGGAAISLADTVAPPRGLAWLDDGTIAFVELGGRAIKRVRDVGGPATTAWKSDTGVGTTATAWFPTAIPGSRGVVFMKCRGGTGCGLGVELAVSDLRSGKSQSVAGGALRGRYVPTGHVIFVRTDGGMLAVPFSARTLQTGGAPVPVLDSITLGQNGFPEFDVSAEGTLFTRTGGVSSSSTLYELVWVDRSGRETLVDSSFSFHLTSYGGNSGWALSPDGTRLAIGLNTEAGDNVWVKQLPRGPLSRVTLDSNASFRPRWTRDGKWVMFISRRVGITKLFKRPADGTGQEELVFATKTSPGIFEGSLSPDEQTLVLRAGGQLGTVGNRALMTVRPGKDSVPVPFIAAPQFDQSGVAISPDGHWIAYESNETTRTEVYIRPFPNADGGKWQVSTDGGRAPLWNRNSRELFFVNGNREMVVAPIGAGAQPQIGARKVLFRMRDELYLANQENYTPFDIALDGQRFMMARTVRTTAAKIAPLVVTENWFTELKQRVVKR